MKEETEEDAPMLEENNVYVRQKLQIQEKEISTEINIEIVKGKFSITRALWPQILLIIAGILFSTSYGMSAGHSAVLLPQLNSTNSSIKFDENIASWIASSHTIVGPVGCLVGGIIIDIWGRKKMLVFANLGMIIGWVMITTSQHHIVLIAGRIFEGITKNIGASAITVLTDETADPKLRGSTLSISIISISVGVFTISGLGSVMNWRTASGIAAAINCVALIASIIILESPTWLVRQNRIQEAHHVLNRIWGPKKEFQAREELLKLMERLRHVENNQETTHSSGYNTYLSKILQFLRILFSPHVLKPFLIIHALSTFKVLCGHEYFVSYSVDIFTRINKIYNSENQNEYLLNIIMSGVRILIGIFSTICMFRINRRPIALVSSSGCFISTLTIAVFLFIKNSSNSILISDHVEVWIIFSLIVIFTGSYAYGLYALVAVMIGETQSTLIRGFACGYIFTVTNLFSGMFVKTYYSMLEAIEMQGMFLFFGISSLLITIFVYLFLPETQGKTLLEIEDYFRQPNIMWITRKRYSNNVGNMIL